MDQVWSHKCGIKNRIIIYSGLLSVSILFFVCADAQTNITNCGLLSNSYGPYDYTSRIDRAEKLPIVEKFHFTESIKNLLDGTTGSPLIADLDYTLRAFPNHPYALWAMARYQMEHPNYDLGKFRTAACYFERATQFRPNDPAPWMIYGMYLAKTKKYEEAVEKYGMSLILQPNSSEANYNAALVYFDLGQYIKARELAQKAYLLGYPLPGLKSLLSKVGYPVEDTVYTDSDTKK